MIKFDSQMSWINTSRSREVDQLVGSQGNPRPAKKKVLSVLRESVSTQVTPLQGFVPEPDGIAKRPIDTLTPNIAPRLYFPPSEGSKLTCSRLNFILRRHGVDFTEAL